MSKNKKEWFVSDFNMSEIDKLVKLIKSEYSGIVSSRRYIKWQYYDNPAGKAIIKIAKNIRDEIIGIYAVIPYLYIKNQKEILGSLSVNTLTHKDYRGLGIFQTLAKEVFVECKKRGVGFTIGFPNPTSHPIFINKLNFLSWGVAKLFIFPVKISTLLPGFLPHLIKSFLSSLISFFIFIYHKIYYTEDIQSEYEIREIDELTKYESSFIQLENKVKKLVVKRNIAYLKWRYSNNPKHKYTIIGAFKGNKLHGISFATVDKIGKINVGFISDVIIVKGINKNPEIFSILIRKIVNKLKKKSHIIGFLSNPWTDFTGLLKKDGFIPCPKFFEPQPFHVIIKYHKIKPINFNDYELTLGDFDIG